MAHRLVSELPVHLKHKSIFPFEMIKVKQKRPQNAMLALALMYYKHSRHCYMEMCHALSPSGLQRSFGGPCLEVGMLVD